MRKQAACASCWSFHAILLSSRCFLAECWTYSKGPWLQSSSGRRSTTMPTVRLRAAAGRSCSPLAVRGILRPEMCCTGCMGGQPKVLGGVGPLALQIQHHARNQLPHRRRQALRPAARLASLAL